MGFIEGILGAGAKSNNRKIERIVPMANELEDEMHALSDDELRQRASDLRDRVSGNAMNEESTRSLSHEMAEACALAREATLRQTGKRLFDEQLQTALALDMGYIAEAATGEGKALACVPAEVMAYVRNMPLHVITANEYLAARDAEECGACLSRLGITTGLIYNGMSDADRVKSYKSDVVYSVMSEFGFDYLRDHMKRSAEAVVQVRGLGAAIIDEADSILIDEAKTPLIIAGQGGDAPVLYMVFASVVRNLKEGVDYELDEMLHTIGLTDVGYDVVENRLGNQWSIWDDTTGALANYLKQALTAEYMYRRDREYIVTKDGEVKIVDPGTGRIMEGRRYSEGLHQAIEAKEKVRVKADDTTVATVTIQDFLHLYRKIGGMTGTALTSSGELMRNYGTDVVVIPRHKPCQRIDDEDVVYVSWQARDDALIKLVIEQTAYGRPFLIGTTSVEDSERLDKELTAAGIPHNVLNAKDHERESNIIAQAGRPSTVTIATNMAGRGTDIKLGGDPEKLAMKELNEQGYDGIEGVVSPLPTEEPPANPAPVELWEDTLAKYEEQCKKENKEVIEAGGLFVIGTDLHDSIRVDNQLRGRSGRQGDPGETQFMLSLDDRTMNIYMQEQMQKAKQRFIAMAKGTDDSFLRDPLPAAMVHKALRTAQKKAEEMNLDARNNMLDFEAPKDKQRLAIYAMREDVLSGIMSSDDILEMGLDLIIDDIIAAAKTGKANTFDANKLPVLLSIVTSMPVSECDILGDADVQLVGADDIEMAEGATVEDRIDAMAGVFANEVKPHKIKEKNLRKQIMMFIKDRLVQVEAELARHGKSFDDVIREYMITNIDSEWGNHLTELDSLRRGIGLRGFAQRDPKSEFSIEAYASFEEFMYRLRKQAVCYMCHIRDTDERGTRYTMMGKLEDIEIRNYTVRREALLDEEFVKEAKFRY